MAKQTYSPILRRKRIMPFIERETSVSLRVLSANLNCTAGRVIDAAIYYCEQNGVDLGPYVPRTVNYMRKARRKAKRQALEELEAQSRVIDKSKKTHGKDPK